MFYMPVRMIAKNVLVRVNRGQFLYLRYRELVPVILYI